METGTGREREVSFIDKNKQVGTRVGKQRCEQVMIIRQAEIKNERLGDKVTLNAFFVSAFTGRSDLQEYQPLRPESLDQGRFTLGEGESGCKHV